MQDIIHSRLRLWRSQRAARVGGPGGDRLKKSRIRQARGRIQFGRTDCEGVMGMAGGHGGARKGAGRPPKPLSQKIEDGNPGNRQLRKVDFGDPNRPIIAPSYLALLNKGIPGLPSPEDIFYQTAEYLEPSGCLHLVPLQLLSDYAVSVHYLVLAQYELTGTAAVAKNEKKQLTVTAFADVLLKMQKNCAQAWQQIWDIVQRNSERPLSSPEAELIAKILSGRVRKKTKEEKPHATASYAAPNGGEAESGGVQSED